MNERIKELANEATEYANEQNELYGVGYVITFKEKFAELIVRECVGILSVNEDTKIKMGLDEPMFKLFKGIAKAYSDNIKEHFGVEE
jgi:hypothetical protein